MQASTPRPKRWWKPAAILSVAGGLILWAHLEESFIRFYAYAFLPVLAILFVATWYLFSLDLPGATRRRIFVTGLTGLVGLGVVLGALFRWDDTWGGTSLPKPTWRWAPRKEDSVAKLAPPEPAAPLTERRGEVQGVLRDWPSYLGPQGNGVVPNLRLAPDWKTQPPRELWRQPVGIGWASFAVSGRNAVTLEQRGREEWITCRDIVSGDLIWTHQDSLADFAPAMGGRGPRSTPSIRDGKVYTQGVLGRLNCLVLENGKVLWSHEVLSDLEATNLEWGKSNSPLLWNNLVIATGGMTESTPSLVAYDASTGKPVWKAKNGAASYSTPALLPIGGKDILVFVGQYAVTGHDPATGAFLWGWDWPGTFPKVAQPLLAGDNRILVTASYNVGSHLLDLSSGTPTSVWKTIRMKTKFSTPTISGGFAYGFDEGALACIDLANGKRLWKGGDYGFGQHLLVGDLLLIQAEQGDLALVEATPKEFREIARVKALKGISWNIPTLAGNYLLVRNDTEAICYWVPLAP
jgi:outer membrane protein assembly factor BamB